MFWAFSHYLSLMLRTSLGIGKPEGPVCAQTQGEW